MGVRWSGSLVHLVESAEQRQAYNNFRKVRALFRKVTERNPVLSGSMRASWAAGYGDPVYEYVAVPNKQTGMIPLPKPDFNLTYDRKAAWHMWLTNGAPYAGRIEDGWSRQAPSGILRISILEVFGGH